MRLSLFFFIILISFFGSPQKVFATIIKGIIKDDYGDVVPFASVLIKNTDKTTSAGEDGSYFIEVPEGKTTIIVKVVGYRPMSKTILVKGAEMRVDFKLDTEGEALSEVIIKANKEDPAYEIMRKVIAHKAENSKKIKTLETDIYLKGKLYIREIPDKLFGKTLSDSAKFELQKMLNLDSSNYGIIYLLEQVTHYYFKAPNKKFSRVDAIKTSGDPKGLGFATMPPITNIYENNVQILEGVSPRGFISPVNDLSFQYYKFKYISSYMDEGIMINKISFWPKRSNEPTLSGTLYVAEGDWAFQQLELIADKDAQIDNVDTLKFTQLYRRTKNGNWIIQQQVLSPVIKFFGIEIAGDFLTNYNNTKVNEQIPDSIFQTKKIAVYDKTALKKENEYWEEQRPISLSTEEKGNYSFKDSVFIVEQKKKDSLYNARIINYDFVLIGFSYKKQQIKMGTAPIFETMGYNTVEGLTLGLSPYLNYGLGSADSFKVSLPFHYGWSNQKLQASLNFEYQKNDSDFIGKQSVFWGKLGKDVYQINNTNPISPFFNTWITLLNGYNYMKLYEAKKIQLGYYNNLGNGLNIRANVNFEDRTSLENITNYSFVREAKRHISINNPAILPLFNNHKAFITTLKIQYQPGWKFIDYPEYKIGKPGNAPVLEFQYSKGIKGVLKSISDFDKWELGISQKLNLKMLGQIDYLISSGGFLNKNYVGNPDMFHVMGNEIAFVNNYNLGFQTVPYYEYSSTPDVYGELHTQWHLNGILTNKIPGFKKLNWYLVLSSNLLYTSDRVYYTEYGVGLENIGFKLLKVFRIDWYVGKGKKDKEWSNRLQLGTTIPLEKFIVK
ncbi:MAG TPA: DUF5686 family protein [Edaphocola sp.]|nr:DUF5686 family protein [Edaphocola sp.]